MATEPELQLLATWHQEPATAGDISKALAGIWQGVQRREDDDSADAPTQQVITRTSVMNLVVYSSSRGVSERAASAIAHLAGTHPSRSILLVGEPNDPSSSLGASLAAHCYSAGANGRGFCFEQIDITARGGAIEHLPGVVTQLLVHDLPTLLWWPGDPPLSDPFFSDMTGVCDRLIVDSSDFSDPQEELKRLAEFARALHGPCGVSDLNWDRLIEWREVVAQFFDGAAAATCLEHVKEVQVEYAFDPGGQKNSAQALLMVAWLASRLGWELASSESDEQGVNRLQMRGLDGPIAVRISSSRAQHAPPGSLTSIRLLTLDGDKRATFTLSLEDDGELATSTVEIEGSSPVARTHRLEPREENVLLAEEMEAFGRERAYDEALQAAAQLAGRVDQQRGWL